MEFDLSKVYFEGHTYNIKDKNVAVVGRTGSYNDLKDKPEVPALPDGYMSLFAGEPKLSMVAMSGDYNDLTNKPEVPELPRVEQKYNPDSPHAHSGTAIYEALCVMAAELGYDDAPEGLNTLALLAAALNNDPDFAKNLAAVATSGSYNDLKDKPEIPEVPELADVATSGSYNDLKDTPPVTLLSLEASPIWSPSLLDDLDEGVYLYSSDGDYMTRGPDSSAIVIVACVNEQFVDMPDGNRNKIYIFKQIIYSGFGIRVREKATSLTASDYGTYDWKEVPLDENAATKTYVDSTIGDVETALDGIITIQNNLLGVSE